MTNERQGMIAMIIASTSFAFMSLMVKLSGGRIPLFEQVFSRNFVMIFFAIWQLRKEQISFKVDAPHRLALFMRSFLGFLSVVAIFYASNHLYLADAMILQKLNPFFVILAAVLFLGERLSAARVATILAGFAGAAIVIDPRGSFDLFPALAGIGSALLAGGAYVLIRHLAGKVPGIVIIFWFCLFSLVAAAPLMAMDFVVPTPRELVYLILIGIFAAIGQYFVTKAFQISQASAVTLFDYTGVIISPILGYLVFAETLKPSTLIGTVVILTSGILAARLKDNRTL